MGKCRRNCVYRTSNEERKKTVAPGCNYCFITGHSRLKAIYERLGVERLPPEELRKAAKPGNCPCFKEGKRVKVKPKDIPLPGSVKHRAAQRERQRRFDEEQARALHAQGWTDGRIAAAVGVSETTIYKWRTEKGLPAVLHGNGKVCDWERAMELHRAGKCDPEIAAAIGCSHKAVFNWRKRSGLPSNFGRGT